MDYEKICQDLGSKFLSEFGTSRNEISFTLAPARVNIIGEHIDYNGGLVLPAAIDLNLIIVFRKRSDKKIIYKTLDTGDKYEFSIDDEFLFGQDNGFSNYLNGVLKYLIEYGLDLNFGFEVLISSNIPMGSGLSSSAALEICFIQSICSNLNFEMDKMDMALLGMRVENEFLNLHSGIMDQAVISLAKKDTALLLNTDNLQYEYIQLKTTPYVIAVMNTNKSRKLTESKYNERKQESDLALDFFKQHIEVNYLCDIKLDTYEEFKSKLISDLGEVISRRVFHCITEMDRVRLSVNALANNELKNLGNLLYQSHLSLKNNYEVTGKELDSLVFNAMDHSSCIGARMTGAGFSGCAIALVDRDGFDDFANFVGERYNIETGLRASFFPCSACDGVTVI